MRDEQGYYEEHGQVKSASPSPMVSALDYLDRALEELVIQTDRLRKQLDPLMTTMEQVPPNGIRLQDGGGVPSGSSNFVMRIQVVSSRMGEIGQKVSRWCNELEI